MYSGLKVNVMSDKEFQGLIIEVHTGGKLPNVVNSSRPIVGRTLQTRDEWLEGSKGYTKPGYENKGNYRKVAILDEHNGKLLVAKTTKNGKGALPLDGQKNTKYKPNLYVDIKDDEGKPIKKGKKFIQNKRNKDLSPLAIKQMQDAAFSGDSERAKENRKKREELKKQ